MLKIGEADIYPDQDLVRCHGVETALTPRSMDVLVYLAERPGITVSADELLRACWSNDYIADNAVHKAVSEIRQALGDDYQNPRYIHTVRKRGYRLIAPLSSAPRDPFTGPSTRKTLPNSVAVLPLNNFMNDPEQDFFVEGMHEALITYLARIGPLHVISRASVMGYKNAAKSSPEIGGELSVGALVEGSVFRTGDRVRITVQLIEVATDRHLWAESYERELRDVLALQKDVARAIVREIRGRLTPAEEAQLVGERAVDPAAYEAYLKGAYHAESYQRMDGPRLGSGRLGATLEPLRRSIEYHQEAVRRDPGWALAHAGLARAYHWLAGEPGEENNVGLWRKSKAAVLKALELDDGIAQAHESLGYVLHNYDWDWQGAERAYRRAVELDPSATWGYAIFLLSAGQHDEAIANFIRAETRNPNSLMVKAQLGFAYLCVGDFDTAVKQLQKVIELDAEFIYGHLTLGYVYLGKAMYEDAVAEIETAAELSDDAALQMSPHLGYAYALAGRMTEAHAILRELEAVEHGFLPGLQELYVVLGQRDKAVAQFEAAFVKRDRRALILRNQPVYNELRDDPRIQELVRRIGFPQ